MNSVGNFSLLCTSYICIYVSVFVFHTNAVKFTFRSIFKKNYLAYGEMNVSYMNDCTFRDFIVYMHYDSTVCQYSNKPDH